MLREIKNAARAILQPPRDIWRTVNLLGFANRIYRSADGGIFLVELKDSTALLSPKCMWRIPDQRVLDQLMEETCWANTGTALVFVLAASAWEYVPDALQILIFPAAIGLIAICGRSKALVMKKCLEVPSDGYRALGLAKEPELAGLKRLRTVKIGSLALPFIGFMLPHVLKVQWGVEANVIATLLSFGLMFVTGALILAATRLSYRSRLGPADVFNAH